MLTGSLGGLTSEVQEPPLCFSCHSSTYQHHADDWKVSLRGCSGDILWSPKIKGLLTTGAQVRALKTNTSLEISKKECSECAGKVSSQTLLTLMTLWPAMSQLYPQGSSCITNLLISAGPLLCITLCRGAEMDKGKEDQHTCLRRTSTIQSSITEDGTQQHSSVSYKHIPCNSAMSKPSAWQMLAAVPRPPV